MNDPEKIIKRDKCGESFEIRTSCKEDLSCLVDMYHHFSPRPASQGLPPEDPETCRKWVEGIFGLGMNLFAWRGGRIIGHAALIPDPGGRTGEFVVFVHQHFRNLGIGSGLTCHILQEAWRIGYNSVWLTVANNNFIAIKLYNKTGFQFCDMDACERTMVIECSKETCRVHADLKE